MERVNASQRPTASKFRRLAITHALMMGGDAAMVVALADSLFFDIDLDAARSRVLLFLLVGFAPFLVVAPLIGPLIDRVAGGRKFVIQVVALVSGDPHPADGAEHRQLRAVSARVRVARAAEDLRRVEVGDRAVDGAIRGGTRRGQLETRPDRGHHRCGCRGPGGHPAAARRGACDARLRRDPLRRRPRGGHPLVARRRGVRRRRRGRDHRAALVEHPARCDRHDRAARSRRIHVLPPGLLVAVSGLGDAVVRCGGRRVGARRDARQRGGLAAASARSRRDDADDRVAGVRGSGACGRGPRWAGRSGRCSPRC